MADPHESATARQRRIYDKEAGSYDRKIAFLERLCFGGGREWLAERARGEVLEVAIGTGRNLHLYDADVRLTGLELSPQMMVRAGDKARELGRDVTLVEGDAQRLPFADASFDSVVCALALCCIPDPGAAIAEMHRVLVPGGQLLLLDHVASTVPPLRGMQRLFELATVWSTGEYFTRRQLPLVHEAGFQVVEASRHKAGTVERVHAVKKA